MIAICTKLFSLDGGFFLEEMPESDLDNIERRVQKYKTMDGKAEFFDGGWSNADRTLTVRTRDIEKALRLQEIAKFHQEWNVSWRNQFALCHLESVSISQGQATIKLLGVG